MLVDAVQRQVVQAHCCGVIWNQAMSNSLRRNAKRSMDLSNSGNHNRGGRDERWMFGHVSRRIPSAVRRWWTRAACTGHLACTLIYLSQLSPWVFLSLVSLDPFATDRPLLPRKSADTVLPSQPHVVCVLFGASGIHVVIGKHGLALLHWTIWLHPSANIDGTSVLLRNGFARVGLEWWIR